MTLLFMLEKNMALKNIFFGIITGTQLRTYRIILKTFLLSHLKKVYQNQQILV